jgi:hypothetical protein
MIFQRVTSYNMPGCERHLKVKYNSKVGPSEVYISVEDPDAFAREINAARTPQAISVRVDVAAEPSVMDTSETELRSEQPRQEESKTQTN